MRFAIIGAAGHYGSAIEAAAADRRLNLCGIAPGHACENMAGVAASAQAAGLGAPSFDDWRQMVLRADPEVCVVNTRFDLTEPIAAHLLRGGIHVYGEKPAGITQAQLDDLQNAYAAGRAQYLSMLTYFYEAPFYKAYRLIRDGVVGRVRLISAQKSYRLGKRDAFYGDLRTYGGTIPWVGIHAAAWAHWLSGRSAFLTACGHASSACNGGNGSLDVSCVMQFTMEDEILFNANIDYLRPACAPSHGDDRVRVAGTEGIVEVTGGRVHVLSPGFTGVAPHDDVPGHDDNIFAAFVNSIGGSPARFDARDCFAITRAVLCAQESAVAGRSIRV